MFASSSTSKSATIVDRIVDRNAASSSRPELSLSRMMHTRNLNNVIARYDKLARDTDYEGNQVCVSLADYDPDEKKTSKSLVESKRKSAKPKPKSQSSSMIVKSSRSRGRPKRSVEECERMFFDLIRHPLNEANDDEEDIYSEDTDLDDEEEDNEDDNEEDEDAEGDNEDIVYNEVDHHTPARINVVPKEFKLTKVTETGMKSAIAAQENQSFELRVENSSSAQSTRKLSNKRSQSKSSRDISNIRNGASFTSPLSSIKTPLMSTPKHSSRSGTSFTKKTPIQRIRSNTKLSNSNVTVNHSQSMPKSSVGSSESESSDPMPCDDYSQHHYMNPSSSLCLHSDVHPNTKSVRPRDDSTVNRILGDQLQIAVSARCPPQLLDASYQHKRICELFQVLRQDDEATQHLYKSLVDRMLRVLHRTTLPSPDQVQPFFHFSPDSELLVDNVSIAFLFIRPTQKPNHLWNHLIKNNYGESLLDLYRHTYRLIYSWFA